MAITVNETIPARNYGGIAIQPRHHHVAGADWINAAVARDEGGNSDLIKLHKRAIIYQGIPDKISQF